MVRKWLGLGAAGLGGIGIVMVAIGLLMGQISVGNHRLIGWLDNRELIGWLGFSVAALICGIAITRLLQTRNDPPGATDQERRRRSRQQNHRIISALGGFLVAFAFFWTATAAKEEFEQTLTWIFKAGCVVGAMGLAMGIVRGKYTKGDKK